MAVAEPADLVITVSDLHPRHCAWGLREFWRNHGLDFADFLLNGIRADRLLSTGDPRAVAAVKRKQGVPDGE